MKRVKIIAFTLAFTFVLLAFTAQPAAAATRYESLRSYMNSRYDAVRGGYTIPGEGIVRISPTYGAISIMNEVGTLTQRPPPVDITEVLEFSVEHQWTTGDEQTEVRYGGFMSYLLGPVTNEINYRGLVLWQLLKAQDNIPGSGDYDINATANLVWINKTQTESGGFTVSGEAFENGDDPDMLSTAYALASLRIIDTMYTLENAWGWLINETATVNWIESCKEGAGYKENPDSLLPSTVATAAAVIAYKALDPESQVPAASSIQSWLLERQITDYDEPEFIGGFEEGNDTADPNLLSTYFAITALDQLNAISTVNATAAESFVLNCQSADGSFARVPGFETGSLVMSAYACQILNLLDIGGARSILSGSIDPYSPEGALIDWRLLVVVGIVIVALVLAVFAVRLD